jgi:hypothetical protein
MDNTIGKILSLSLIAFLFSAMIQVSPVIPQRERALSDGKAVAEEAAAAEKQLSIENPAPIGPPESAPREKVGQQAITEALEETSPLPPYTFEGIDIDENEFLTDFLIIPPDPIAAVGPEHVVSVVNSSIEWYSKTGLLQTSWSLEYDFFADLLPQSRPFDPKVIYDQYEDRFVVIALVRVFADEPDSDISRILVAVSDDGDPNGTWYLHSIDSKLVINSVMGWADYPGLAIDEEAVYITANIFDFVPNIFGSFDFLASRLWILEKGIGSGGLYDGGAASVALYDPSTEAGLSQAFTLQPAHVFGPGGVPGGVGTFLVNSGWVDGISRDYLSVIRVDDPPGSPSFSNQFIFLDDITLGYGLPDAPQAGTGTAIETNDGRVLHAVWRNNSLWAVSTVNPPSGPDAGQATAHWYQINTSTLNNLSLTQQGNIGGEEIAPDTHTFFPAIAVDALGNVGIGFSASAPTIFPGAYFTGRKSSDPWGSMRPAKTLAAGVDWYIRRFGGTRNRWGDYSGMSVNPTDDRTFWVYNEYALTRGPRDRFGDDGRWGTRFGFFLLCEGDFDEDGDVDGLDLKELIDNITLLDLSEFGIEFARTNCLAD